MLHVSLKLFYQQRNYFDKCMLFLSINTGVWKIHKKHFQLTFSSNKQNRRVLRYGYAWSIPGKQTSDNDWRTSSLCCSWDRITAACWGTKEEKKPSDMVEPTTINTERTCKTSYLFNKHILFFLKLFKSLGNLSLESRQKGILHLFLCWTSEHFYSNSKCYYWTQLFPKTQISKQASYLSVSSSVMINLSRSLGSALLSHQNLCVFFLCSGLKWKALCEFTASSASVSQMFLCVIWSYVLMCSSSPPYITLMLLSVTCVCTSSEQQ